MKICGESGIYSYISLTFSSPRTILGYSFWDSDEDGNQFQWRVNGDADDDYAAVDIPQLGGAASTEFQSIAGYQAKPPTDVIEAQKTLGESERRG